MGVTIIGVGDPKAVRRYGAFLAVDTAKNSYFANRFIGNEGSSMPIHRLTELENDAGDTITYDLNMQLKMQPVEGDAVLEGKEEELKFYTDEVKIDQMRGGVNSGGRMTRKRTIHKIRDVSRKRQSEWWARVFDELLFMYLSGARGTNADFVFPVGYGGFAGNALQAPDAEHRMFPKLSGGDIATAANITSAEKFILDLIDRAVAHAETMGGGTQETPRIMPIMVEGEKHYVCILNPWQAYDLRAATATGTWLDIQKAMHSGSGKKNPIFQGGLGMHNGVVLHQHMNIIRMGLGSGSAVPCARALFLGNQAAVLAHGSPGTGLRFSWHEEERDNGNQVVISTHSIFGVKKVNFNGKDFGVIAIDTAAANPNG